MNRVFSINQGYKVNKRACAARQGDSVPLRVLTNEPVTCRRALWATRQALGDDGPSWLLSLQCRCRCPSRCCCQIPFERLRRIFAGRAWDQMMHHTCA